MNQLLLASEERIKQYPILTMKTPLPILLSAVVFASPAFGQADAALDARIARGKIAFATCSACHGADGKGLPTVPPMAPSLVGSKLAAAAPEVSIAIVLKGIQKMDQKYLGVMAPLGAAMTDEQIADVLTYVRKSWGNTAAPVTAEEVKTVREKYKDINVSLPRTAYEKKAEKLAEEAAGKAGAAPAPK